ncbi:S8 family serine peptidase [Spirosoma sp. SC4-14]|uniref:S8 family peptidase n=1 Tax=Spirosoma sp. SC4-14 TaxID=3128900 RepID=UPI0030CB75F7
MVKPLRDWITAVLASLILIGQPLATQAQIPGKGNAKIAQDLRVLQQNNGGAPTLPPGLRGLQKGDAFLKKDGKVFIEAVAAPGQDVNTLMQQLQALGLENALAFKSIVSGYIAYDKIDDLETVSALRFARPVYRPKHNAGSVTSQGDKALRADIARQTYSVTGAGTKVGVLSDSYDALGGAAAGVASGDLPAGVQVIDDYLGSDASDEGRAMAEIVHDVAPGAAIAFNTAFKGEAAFAKGIKDLATAGCNIIVDDISYFLAPFFQDGIVAQAVDDVVANNGVTYFSSAGNNARHSYQSTYSSGTLLTDPTYGYLGYAHNFSGGDVFQTITIPAHGAAPIVLQWDEPYASVNGGAGAQTDLDLLVYYQGSLIPYLSSANNNLGGDPYEFIYIVNNSSSPIDLELAIVKYDGPDPNFIKWVDFDNGYGITMEYDTKSSTAVGHTNSAGAISVGAARYTNTPAFNSSLTTATIEGFSSAGGTPTFFSPTGDRLNGTTGIVRQKPEITSVDGGNTTFFGGDYEPDGFPNFFGTSAAAPHAAAVAALMQEKAGNSLTRNTILSVLEQTALDMDDPSTSGFDTGFDTGTGYGFIQADKALEAISTSPSDFAIIAVTTVSCATVTASQRLLTFTPQYGQVNGQPISFSVANEMSPTTSPGPYMLTLYTDNPKIVLKATQTGTSGEASYTYDWLAACNGGTTPPTDTFAISAVNTINCTTISATQRTVTFSPLYTGITGQAISFSVVNEMPPTTASGPYTLTLYTDNPAITLKATQEGTAGEKSFIYNWLVACGTTPPPPPPGGSFGISGASTISCITVSATQRTLTFNPQYTGVTGQPISFSVANEMLPTTAAGPYMLTLYTDNPTITLKATQEGSAGEASYTYNWLANCGGGSTRMGAEASVGLQVRVLGNPTPDEWVKVEVLGADNQRLRLQLLNNRGEQISDQWIEADSAVKQHRVWLGRMAGLYLLQVGTDTQKQTVKIIRQ